MTLPTLPVQVPDPTAAARLEVSLDALRVARRRRVRAIAWAILLALLPPFLVTPAFLRARRAAAHARGDVERSRVERAPPLAPAMSGVPGQ